MIADQRTGRLRLGRAVACAMALAAPALIGRAAWAAPSPDLAAIVLHEIAGYKPAPPGVGLSGPLTAEQLDTFLPGVGKIQAKMGHPMQAYARTFAGPGQRTALIVAFNLETVGAAKEAENGAQEGGAQLGTVVPVAGLANTPSARRCPRQGEGNLDPGGVHAVRSALLRTRGAMTVLPSAAYTPLW